MLTQISQILKSKRYTAKKIYGMLLLLFIQFNAFADDDAEMADLMRAEGKIYVVVGVVLIILIGIILYQVNTSKKIKKLEQLISEKEQAD